MRQNVRTEKQDMQRTAVTIGKFDGLHRGHQKLLTAVCAKKQQGLKSVVLSIGNQKPKVLLTREEKQRMLKELGIDIFAELPFTEELSQMEPEQFVKEILVEKYHAAYVAVGEDFHFGHNRRGDGDMLRSLSESCGFQAEIIEKARYGDREISSTYIREALEEGNMELVQTLLGYPYSVSGEVLHGRKIGRTLGLPTTNLLPAEEKLLPPNGVYVTRTLAEGQCYGGITNVGLKPTVGAEKRPGVETYLFDYEGDLYGKHLQVCFCHYERPERKFPSLELLKAQIERDVQAGRRYFLQQEIQ